MAHPSSVLVGLSLAVASTSLLSGCAPECKSFTDCPPGESCSSELKCVPEPDRCPDGPGSITGTVTTPDGISPVAGAIVSLDGDQGLTVVTGADGKFRFDDVAGGDHVVAGRRNAFAGNVRVEVCEGRPTEADVKVAPPPHSMAVVPGDYDSIEAVLAGMGLSQTEHYDLITADDLKNLALLSTYDYLFLNCTSSPLGSDPAVQATLRTWVERGGRVYVSDYAYEYVAFGWPAEVEFPENPYLGDEGVLEDVDVVDADLRNFLGKAEVDLAYNLPAWVVVADVASAGRVLVSNNEEALLNTLPSAPLLVQFPVGDGQVTFTTFHNEAQTTADMDQILVFLVFTI